MEVTFFGVRGSIPAPGPATVRYGGNTSCVAVRLGSGELIILDCGTGARNLGLALLAGDFGQGRGRATFLLSHAHWDHIQGFPFFVPFYTPGNRFTVYGWGRSPNLLEQVLEGQMAAQYFPVQTIKNMASTIDVKAVPEDRTFPVGSALVSAHAIPHGPTMALAFRIEEGGKVLAYASDAGYDINGPSEPVLALFRRADLLIHDATFTPEDRAARLHRGLSSVDDAVDAAVAGNVRRLALFHYDQDYTDHDVDQLMVRARSRLADNGAAKIELIAAAEGLSVRL
jgi:phosphoribosyl 1,2-cyclic phosphodiesterase